MAGKRALALYDGEIREIANGDNPLGGFPPSFAYQSIKIVQTLADFPAPVGRYIDLADGVIYFIDSDGLDITGYTIRFGARSQLNGFGQNVSAIRSSENGATLFQSATNLFMNDLEIYCDGSNQMIWSNIASTGFESFEINRMACYSTRGNGNKCGYIQGIRQGFMGTQFFFGFDNGFEFAGTWSGGFRIAETLWRNCGGKFYYSSPTLPVVFGARFSSNANIEVGAGVIGYDFPQTAFTFSGQYQLQNGNASGVGIRVADFASGFPAYDQRANFQNNSGIQNTFVGGEWINAANTITNSIVQNQWYQIVFSTTNRGLTWFSESNGEFTYLGDTPVDIQVTLTITIFGTSNNIIEILLAKVDSLNVQTNLLSRFVTIQGTLAQGRAESVVITTTTQLNYLDKIRIFGRNTSAGQPFTASIDSNCIINAK